MIRFNKDTFIECLPLNIYKELVNALNKDGAWMTLANHVAKQLQYPCVSWIQFLKATKPDETPGEKLLSELNIKMCTVEILRVFLNDCELLNILSIISDLELLNIIMHPTEELQTDTLKIPFGRHLRLCCKASGMPPPNYVWYHENRQLQYCTTNQLDVVITSASQAGEYKCKVLQIKNDGTIMSTLTSKAVTVQIFPVPIIVVEQPQPILKIKDGESFTICCKANGYPEPCYQWFYGNTKLEGETSNTLHIKKFRSEHEGEYRCYIHNDISEDWTQSAHIKMDVLRLKAVAKIALIIANEKYEHHEHLLTPRNDAACIANLLKDIGFEVICLINLTIVQMKNVIRIFSKALVEGVYGLFYFAGHGFEMQKKYMLATDSPEMYLRRDAICEDELLAAFLENDPELLVIILDMCQTLPSKEHNPEIYREVPTIHEYRSKKNRRNLFRAYSTFSQRPSYEKVNNMYGLYMTHLSKYISKDTTVTKLFDEVGKSIDSCFKGKERKQIPEYSTITTKPFRLTDALYKRNRPDSISYLSKIISFSTKTLEVTFKQVNMSTRIMISLFMDTYLNFIKIKILDSQDVEINFLNSNRVESNILYPGTLHNKECWIHNPQINERPLVICVSRNGTPIDETRLYIKDYIPLLLKLINS